MRLNHLSLLVISSTCIVFLTGCVNVQAWERGNLAKPGMALDPYPQQSQYRAHNYGSREASTGGSESTGGGCGCY